jgi:hypothetical protein
MKNNDFWKRFVRTGRIDDYLHYIACTREECMDDFMPNAVRDKEGGVVAGTPYRDGNGSVSHAV